MAALVPTTQSTVTETNTEDQEESLNTAVISSRLYLKPTHTSETLDKNVVLRRIRHRKRLNKLRNALQGLLGWSVQPKTDKLSDSVYEKKWVDDAFAAP